MATWFFTAVVLVVIVGVVSVLITQIASATRSDRLNAKAILKLKCLRDGCGCDNPADALFCRRCGASLINPTETANP